MLEISSTTTGLHGTGGRRRHRGTGHRSLNPNVTPPGLRPGAREGEPQASRCRSRVSVPSSAVERWPGLGRLDPSGAAMHKLLVLANALVGQNRPGETGQPVRGSVAVGGKCAGHRRVSCPVHADARHAGDLVDHHGAARNRRSPSPSRHRTPVTEPQRHSPRSATGGAGGRAAGESMPFPRQRSVVGR